MENKNSVYDQQKWISVWCMSAWGFYFIVCLFMQKYNTGKFILFLAGGITVLVCMLLSFFSRYRVHSILLPAALFSCGMLLMITEEGVTISGDFFILAGIILFFIYHGINAVLKFAVVFIPVVTACIRLLLSPAINSHTVLQALLTAASSCLLIWLAYEAIRRKDSQLRSSKMESDVLASIGLNLAAIRHDFNLAVEVDCIRFLIEDIENNDRESALKSANTLLNLVKTKHAANEDLLNAVEFSKSFTTEPVNIHLLIDSILQIARLDKEVFIHITFRKEFAEENFCIDARACELYFIFQNIVANAVEAMLQLKERKSHTLTITTANNSGIITIVFKDTGGGVSHAKANRGKAKNGSRRLRGFGLRYVNETVKKYGSLEIEDNREGATVVLTLQGAGK